MVDTHNLIVDFGQYKGHRWTRLPLKYLKWLINVESQYANIAKAELERRGETNSPDKMELTAHAIDRASLFCIKQWRETRKREEGLFTWLHRTAGDALATGEITGVEAEGRIYQGMKFIFKFGEITPILITVMNKDERRSGEDRRQN